MIKLLYLRSVYWFNLVSGGSVGHTAGVINALKKKVEIDVYSNDILVAVASKINVIPPIRFSFLPNEG